MKSYTPEEKQAVIDRYISGGESPASILANTGIPKSTFYSWLRAYKEEHNAANKKAVNTIITSRPFMIRLILDFGIETVCLHFCDHTGQTDDISMIFVECRFQLSADFDVALKICKISDNERLPFFLF